MARSLTACLFGLTVLLSPLRGQQLPAITYAASLEAMSGMTSDAQGNVYVVGSSGAVTAATPGAAYATPPLPGGYATNSYLIKLDPQGGLVFATYLPGTAFGVAVDHSGNAYVGAYTISVTGEWLGFLVATVDPTGATVTTAKADGGVSAANSFALDGQGNVYLAGNTGTADLPTTPGAFQPKKSCPASGCNTGFTNGYIIKLSPKTGQVIYATYLGGSCPAYLGDAIYGVAADASGNFYATGSTCSTDFPVTPNAYRTTLATNTTTFITKLDPSGVAVYSTYFDARTLYGVAADASGAVFVTGLALTGTPLIPDAASGGAVVAKLSPDGRSLIFASLFDPDGSGGWVAVDASGSPTVSGATYGTRFPQTTPLQGQRGNTNPPTICDPDGNIPCRDAFLLKLDPLGKQVIWASTLGGAGDDSGGTVALDSAGNTYAWIAGFAGLPLPGTVGGGNSIIKVEPAAGPPPLFGGKSVVSSAGFTPGIAGGSLVSIFGTGLSTADGIVAAPGFPLPTTLAGTSVWFGGGLDGGRPAPILAAAKVNGQEQLNVQVPVLGNALDYPVDLLSKVIVRKGRALGFAFDVNAFIEGWPSIFLSADGEPIVTHADYSLVSASSPAHAGETVVIFATGLGAVSPPVATGVAAPLSPLSTTAVPFSVAIGGQNAPVAFCGLAPGFAGLNQVNVLVPAVSAGQVKLTLGVGTSVPVTVTIAVQ